MIVQTNQPLIRKPQTGNQTLATFTCSTSSIQSINIINSIKTFYLPHCIVLCIQKLGAQPFQQDYEIWRFHRRLLVCQSLQFRLKFLLDHWTLGDHRVPLDHQSLYFNPARALRALGPRRPPRGPPRIGVNTKMLSFCCPVMMVTKNLDGYEKKWISGQKNQFWPKNLHFFTLRLYNPHFFGSDGPDSMGS